METSFFTKNKYKHIWLDLELRKDIDDFLTLIFALENKLNISEISIHNPSVFELSLLQSTLNDFNFDIPIIVSGNYSTYDRSEDIHHSLINRIPKVENSSLINFSFKCYELNSYLKTATFENKIVFCGGSLFTLSEILKSNTDSVIDAYIQGGYASASIVGSENVLKKFKKREKVPTWNLNLDLVASDYVMNCNNVNCHFISKNVCHDSFVGLDDLNNYDCVFNNVFREYLKDSKYKNKCLHDLLAFFSIFNDDIVKFTNVDLFRTEDNIPKWFSIKNPNSNKKISICFDKDLFLKVIKNFIF